MGKLRMYAGSGHTGHLCVCVCVCVCGLAYKRKEIMTHSTIQHR